MYNMRKNSSAKQFCFFDFTSGFKMLTKFMHRVKSIKCSMHLYIFLMDIKPS